MDAGLERRLHEILAFTHKQAKAFALSSRRKAAHELEAGVGGGGDQANHSSHWPWKPPCASSRFSPSGQTRSQRPE